jgi:putative two-component system response regulator
MEVIKRKKILTVDDDDYIREIFEEYLEDRDYKVLQAENGLLGLETFHRETPDLVMLDIRMPEMDGLELLEHITQESPDTPVIVISGVGEIGDAIKALKLGAWDYIPKPIHDMEVVEHAINQAFERAEFIEHKKSYQEHLEKEVRLRTKEVELKRAEAEEANIDLQKALEATINIIAKTAEMRDPYTAGHQRRTATLAKAIAAEMGLSGQQIEGVFMAGVVHDLGKISVPAEILTKPGRLSDVEFSLISTHSQTAYELLKTISFPWPIAQIVYQHHERLDGSGYPQGLLADQILLEAKVLCVADAVEAMASDRPYRPAKGVDVALEHIQEEKGTLYDPDAVDTCVRLFNEKGYQLD